MRDYGKVYVSFWSSEDIRSINQDGRMLALYLMTSSHTTMTGTFRLPDGYVCEDLGWNEKRVAEGFVQLLSNGFANRCETTKWVWIRKHLDWNPPENPNQRKAAKKLSESIPAKCSWKADFIGIYGEVVGHSADEVTAILETLAQPFRNQDQDQDQDQEQEQKQDQDQEQEIHHVESDEDFDLPYDINLPLRSGNGLEGEKPGERRSVDHDAVNSVNGKTHTQSTRAKSAVASKSKAKPEVPPEFEQFKLAYPKRAGDPGWQRALRAIHARLDEKHTWAEMIAGALRYHEYCEATDKVGTEYVKQASTFVGPDKHFLLQWTPPASRNQRRQDKNISVAQQWLDEQDAKDRAELERGGKPHAEG